MRMSRDPQGGGANTDGSRNKKFCSHCYANGDFTLPNITASEMQSRVSAKLLQFGVPAPEAKEITDGIPKLERWIG